MHRDILQHCVKVAETCDLRLRKLYHAELVVLVEYSLDRRGLSAAAIAVKQRVLRRESVQERYGVLYDLIALKLVILEVGQPDGIDVLDGYQLSAAERERLVLCKIAGAVLLRELYQAVGGECELAALILRKRRVVGGRARDIRKRLLYR